MKQIVLRGLRKDETITIVTLFTLSFSLCEGLMFQALLEDWSSPSERLFDIVLMLTCALFIGGATAWFIQEYHKCICITENSVILMSGKNVIKLFQRIKSSHTVCIANTKSISPVFLFSAMHLSTKFPQLQINIGTGESGFIAKSNWMNWKKHQTVCGQFR